MYQHQKLHRNLLERAPEPAVITTNGLVVSVVYVTAQPTFTGVIGGYSTVGNSSDDDEDASTQRPTQTRGASSSVGGASATQTQRSQSVVSRSSSILANTIISAAATSSLAATGYSSSPTDFSQQTNTAIAGASSTNTPSNSTTEGMSIGAKIGMGVGIMLGLALIALVALLLLARKKKQKRQEAEAQSEKKIISKPAIQNSSTMPPPNPPRLSLRPVSSLVPEFMGGAKQNKRLSQGNQLTAISEAANARARNQQPPQAMSQIPGAGDRPRNGENPFRDPENPFADPEKAMGAATGNPSAPISPITPPATADAAIAHHATTVDPRSSGPTAESFPLPASQTHGPAAAVIPVHPPRSAPAHITVPTNYAELPAGAPSPTIAQGPGPDLPQGNVYRILLDFRPTMEDELELRTGQLVRMLHEYDDGWALCIRLDRSQQGVVPRTCLAAKPSKPRPGPPPMGGPGPRPMTPQGRPRGPPGPVMGSPRAQAPAPSRSQSPATVSPNNPGAFNQPPRPLSPGPRPQPQQRRSQSPGPYGAGGPKPMAPAQQRRRSNSTSGASVRSKRNSPPGPSKLGPGSPASLNDSPGLAI